MDKKMSNLLVAGLVVVATYFFFKIDNSEKKAKQAIKRVEKKEQRKVKTAHNNSLVNVLKVATPLLKPVVDVAIEEFKASRNR